MPSLRILHTLTIALLLCLPTFALCASGGEPQASSAMDDHPVLVSLIVPVANNRPTSRATQAKGRIEKKRKYPTIPVLPAREYRDLVNGFRVEYRNEWSFAYSPPNPGSYAPSYDWVMFGNDTYPETGLAVGVLDLKRPVTATDLKSDFAAYTRDPVFEEQFRNPRYLLMSEVISSKPSVWNDRETLVSTFTHRLRSQSRMVRHIRIPAGNRIIVLEYSTTVDRFDRDLHYFEDFAQSFALL